MSEIRLYLLCKGMKWAHLPVDGGIYAQHPKLIDRFHYMMMEENKAEAERQRAEEAKSKKRSPRRKG